MTFARPAFFLRVSPSLWRLRCSIVGLAGRAAAQLRVDITQGTIQPMPIAIPPFVGAAGGVDELSQNVAQVVTADLKRSGLFAPVDPCRLHRAGRAADRHAELRQLAPAQCAGARLRQRHHDRRRPHHGRVPPVGRRFRPISRRQTVLRLAGQLAAARPHHRRFRLRAADRREGLFRHAASPSSTRPAARRSA